MPIYYGLNIQTVTVEAVGAVHAAGGQVFVWTADTPEQIKNVRKMGVDGIVTNRPGVAKVMLHPEYDFLAEHYEKSITVPGLYEQNLPEKCGDMVMQGLTRTTGSKE